MLTPIYSVLQVSVKYFPLFACVDSPVPLVGHFIGLLYLPFLYVCINVYEITAYLKLQLNLDHTYSHYEEANQN